MLLEVEKTIDTLSLIRRNLTVCKTCTGSDDFTRVDFYCMASSELFLITERLIQSLQSGEDISEKECGELVGELVSTHKDIEELKEATNKLELCGLSDTKKHEYMYKLVKSKQLGELLFCNFAFMLGVLIQMSCEE